MDTLLKILFLVGIHLYAIGEGVTEATVWESTRMRDTARGMINEGKYHFWRIIEMLGLLILFLLFAVYCWGWIIAILYTVAAIFIIFAVYRTAFVTVRKQGISNILPDWKYTLWIPIMNKDIDIPYPFPGKGRVVLFLYAVITIAIILI